MPPNYKNKNRIAVTPDGQISLFTFVGYRERLMTVIKGIPFYCSSGFNSGEAGTWFPHRGIEVGTNWIMKPGRKYRDMPKDLLTFLRQLQVNEHTLYRLGNLQALCISASIGGGFWAKSQGIQLKTYLKDHYMQHFLSEEIVSEFQAAQSIKKIVDAHKANLELYRLGSLIPLNQPDSRLYTLEESHFLAKASDQIKPVLTQMLMKKQDLTRMHYKVASILAERHLLNYAINNYFLEGNKHLHRVYKQMRSNPQMSILDIIALNPIYSFKQDQRYAYLAANYYARCAVRIISARKSVEEQDLELIKCLVNQQVLQKKLLSLFKNKEAYLEMISLLENNSLNAKSVKFLLHSGTENLSLQSSGLSNHGLFSLTKNVGRKPVLADLPSTGIVL